MVTKKDFQSLTLPRLTWNKAMLSETHGELVAQPLEPGFGITLGELSVGFCLGEWKDPPLPG